MRHLLSLLLLLMITFSVSGQESGIIGHWRRLDVYRNQGSNVRPTRNTGDLIISADSTFTIVGDESKASLVVPGWHANGTIKGKWALDQQNQLNFLIDSLAIPVAFKIKKLNKKELHLKTNFRVSPIMKLRRI